MNFAFFFPSRDLGERFVGSESVSGRGIMSNKWHIFMKFAFFFPSRDLGERFAGSESVSGIPIGIMSNK